jgi:hypothetical protein
MIKNKNFFIFILMFLYLNAQASSLDLLLAKELGGFVGKAKAWICITRHNITL